MTETKQDIMIVDTADPSLSRPGPGKQTTLELRPACNGLNVVVNKCVAAVHDNGLIFDVSADLKNAEDAASMPGTLAFNLKQELDADIEELTDIKDTIIPLLDYVNESPLSIDITETLDTINGAIDLNITELTSDVCGNVDVFITDDGASGLIPDLGSAIATFLDNVDNAVNDPLNNALGLLGVNLTNIVESVNDLILKITGEEAEGLEKKKKQVAILPELLDALNDLVENLTIDLSGDLILEGLLDTLVGPLIGGTNTAINILLTALGAADDELDPPILVDGYNTTNTINNIAVKLQEICDVKEQFATTYSDAINIIDSEMYQDDTLENICSVLNSYNNGTVNIPTLFTFGQDLINLTTSINGYYNALNEAADIICMTVIIPNSIHGHCTSGYNISNLFGGDDQNGELFYMKKTDGECAPVPVPIMVQEDLEDENSPLIPSKWVKDSSSDRGFTVYSICGKVTESACIDELYMSFDLPCKKVIRLYGSDNSDNTECIPMCITYTLTHKTADLGLQGGAVKGGELGGGLEGGLEGGGEGKGGEILV